MSPVTKFCKSCNTWKPVDAFKPRRAKCRDCMNAERRAMRNPSSISSPVRIGLRSFNALMMGWKPPC